MEFPFVYVRDWSVKIDGIPEASFGSPVNFGDQKGGIFANWEWDADKRELRAEVDPYGLFSLFYSETADGVMLSTSPIQLMAQGARPGLDTRALAVFHIAGWFIEQDTPFRHIKVIPPGGRLFWKNGKLSVTGGRPSQRPAVISRTAAVQQYARLFSKAIRACGDALQHCLVIPLSGGRDSRHITLETTRQGIPIDHCATLDPLYDRGSDPDLDCARMIATRLGLRHTTVKSLHSRYRDQIHNHCLSHLCTDESVHIVSLARYVETQNCAIFDGIGGDMLSRNQNLTHPKMHVLFERGAIPEAVDLFRAEIDLINGSSFAERVGSNQSIMEAEKEARQQLMDCFSEHQTAADPFTNFLFWHRIRREIALSPGAVLGVAKAVFCPYVAPDLAEFCASLPFEITADGKFHDAVIQTSFPDIDIPYHDAIKPVWPRPPISAKAKMVAEGIVASRALGLTPMITEPLRQARMLIDRKYKKLFAWRTYHQTIAAISSRRKAARYLAALQ